LVWALKSETPKEDWSQFLQAERRSCHRTNSVKSLK